MTTNVEGPPSRTLLLRIPIHWKPILKDNELTEYAKRTSQNKRILSADDTNMKKDMLKKELLNIRISLGHN